jgi:DNA-binding transcriptional LysR family regulator
MGTVVNLRPLREEGNGSRAPEAVPAAARVLVRAPELAELRAFCAAVDLGSIGKAARLMQVSQPALSKRLQALEAVAGTRLLDRSTRGVTATATGAQLYATARRLLTSADAVETLMRGFAANPAPVRIAASPTVADWWLPGALVDLESRHERHLSVEVVTANSSTVRQMVREARSDVGLAAVDPDEHDSGLLETIVWADEVVVAVPAGHRWVARNEIDPIDFITTPVITRDPGANSSRIVEQALGAVGMSHVPPVAEIGCTAAARATAIAQCVPALLPRDAVRHEPAGGLVARRVRGIRFERQFALILAGSLQDLTPHARALAQHPLAWADR